MNVQIINNFGVKQRKNTNASDNRERRIVTTDTLPFFMKKGNVTLQYSNVDVTEAEAKQSNHQQIENDDINLVTPLPNQTFEGNVTKLFDWIQSMNEKSAVKIEARDETGNIIDYYDMRDTSPTNTTKPKIIEIVGKFQPQDIENILSAEVENVSTILIIYYSIFSEDQWTRLLQKYKDVMVELMMYFMPLQSTEFFTSDLKLPKLQKLVISYTQFHRKPLMEWVRKTPSLRFLEITGDELNNQDYFEFDSVNGKYYKGDIVHYKGTYYQAQQDQLELMAPDSDPMFWEVVKQRPKSGSTYMDVRVKLGDIGTLLVSTKPHTFYGTSQTPEFEESSKDYAYKLLVDLYNMAKGMANLVSVLLQEIGEAITFYQDKDNLDEDGKKYLSDLLLIANENQISNVLGPVQIPQLQQGLLR